MSVTVDTSEVDALAREFVAAAVRVVVSATQATSKASADLAKMAESVAPRRTGELAAGFDVIGSGLEQGVENRTRQAFYQEFGTTRHPPQPSLFPSADRVEPQFVEAVGDAGVDALR